MRPDRGVKDERSSQFLTFWMGEDAYALDILRVREIRGWSKPREILNVPKYIKGVIEFRGGIVPIVDLRMKFSLGGVNYSRETVVILVSIMQAATARSKEGDQQTGNDHQQEHVVGMVVDRVADVLDIKPEEIKAKPELGSKLDTRYLRGLVKTEEGMVLLIDVDSLLDPETFSKVIEATDQ
ncbi:chemotaxis protein CheW [Hahella sp. CCB-MM4]|uniref:chemotaxis protein CheW n=1 Tax=Hahella sp. (strain CCB-MM4) TaxID=1926491 RepID=UPI000B9B356C|nr:chemotaxis protein CheW [Hahella sp. CCB-MM4]OZG75288.1 chemotaxis protein CheW [Hahella sp. CCB-MM4]